MVQALSLVLRLAGALLAAVLTANCTAQSTCYHSGSLPVMASWAPSPLPLGCNNAPNWPMWRTFTPAHRTPAAHFGFRPGRSEAVPVIVVQYRCTGQLLNPVVVSSHNYLGYVIDMPEHLCD